jgi:hypothetical protein
MNTPTKKITTSLILLTFVIPVAFLSLPTEVHAVAGSAAACTAGFASSAAAQAPDAVHQTIGVPKASLGDFFQGIFTGGSVNTEAFKSCVLKPLGQVIAITLIRNIGASVINWVNTGFDGNPTFVTNLDDTLRDTADQAIGTFIEGSDLGFLCNDFGFQVRLALALKYSQPFREQARCTLSKIENNISTNGGRGWDNFLSVSTEPQNNVYGAYFIAESELAQRAANAVGIKEKRIAIAEGFLDFETCDEYESDTDLESRLTSSGKNSLSGSDIGSSLTNTGTSEFETFGTFSGEETISFDGGKTSVTAQKQVQNFQNYGETTSFKNDLSLGGVSKRQCKPGKMTTKTPGKIISDKLSSVLGQSEIQAAVASEIDQVIAATLNQLAQKVIQGSSGLFGLSKKRSSSAPSSYLDTYRAQYYGQSGATTGGATSEIQDYQLDSYDQTGALLNDPNDPNLSSINKIFDSTVSAGSERQQEQIASLAESSGSLTGGLTGQNISLLKPASQSSGANPSGANDGVTQTSQYIRGSSTGSDDASPWWEVDLREIKKIKEVRVWAVSDKPASQTLETFRVSVRGGAGQWSSNLISGAGSANPIIVPVNQSGNTVRIEKIATPYQCSRFQFDEDCYHPLELAEVQVIEDVVAPVTSTNTSTNTSNTTTQTTALDTRTGTSTLSWTPATPLALSISAGVPLNQELKLNAEKTATSMIVEIGLYKNGVLVPFLNVFNSDFDIMRGISGGSKTSSQSVITPSIGAIRFGVSVNGNSNYSFTLKGSLRTPISSGEYSFRAKVSDSTGTELTDKSYTATFSL